MNDLKTITLDKARVESIVAKFAEAGNTAQEGFYDLVEYGAEVLGEHTDANGKVAKTARTLLMLAFETELLDKANLSKSYFAPAVTLAYGLASGSLSTAFDFVWDNFCDVGDNLDNSVVRGPLYSPSRLSACWGKLNQKKGRVIIEVTPDGLLVAGHPWHTLTIKELRNLNQGQEKDPRVEDIMKALLGNYDNLDKQPGSLMKTVDGLRDSNETLESENLEGLALRLQAFIEEERLTSNVAIADEEAKSASERADKMRDEAAEQREKLAESRTDVTDDDEERAELEATIDSES